MATVAKNTSYLTAALIGQKILSFVYFTLLARFLGPEIIGKYTFVLAFTTIFAIITDLGLTPVLIRETARDKNNAQNYLRVILCVKFALMGLAYLAVMISAYWLGHPRLILELIALAGIVMALDAAHLTLYGILRGLQILKYEAIGMVSGQGITLAVGALALLAGLPLYSFIFALCLGSAWNVLFSLIIVKRRGINLLPKWNWPVIRSVWLISVPFALSGVFTRVYSYIDAVLLQHIKGDLAVGWYSIPYKITYAFQFLPMALSAAIYPALSAAWRQDKARLKWIFERAIRYSILIALPIAFGIAALAPEIIRSVYGAEFENSILPLQISIFGLIFIFLYFPVGALLNATDRQAVNTVFMGLTMLINVAINLALIPRYGAVGASIAAVSTAAFLFFGTFIWSAAFMRPSAIVIKTFFKTLIATLVMFAIVIYAKSIMFWPLSILIGAAAYGLLIYLFRALTREDIKKLTQLLRKERITP